ncbi:MAG: MucBP domain-containing protein [Candidatus Saccharibacteria bacterium]|nr:MucBP domain-containing protein [Candidatus Saccharibacteria bacterium]
MRGKKVFKAAFVTVLSLAFLYGLIFKSMFAGAEALYLSGVVYDDNGEALFAAEGNSAAEFSYVRSGSFGATSKIYDAKIRVSDLPASGVSEKKLTISLPVGMAWVDDASADKNLKTQLDTSKGANGIEKKSVDQAPVMGYKFADSGERSYYMLAGTESMAVNFKVRLDTAVDLKYITDAIVAKLSLDNYSESIKIDVNAPTNESANGRFYTPTYTYYVTPGSVYDGNEGYNKLIRASYAGGVYDVKRLALETRLYYHVDNPKAKIKLTTTDPRYSLDESGADNGDYVVIYKPTEASNMSFYAPWSVSIPEDVAGGSEVIVTGRGETDFWQTDGSTKTLNYANTFKLTLKVAPNSERVSIGINDLNPTDTATAKNLTAATRVYPAEHDVMTGVLGYNYIANRGSVDSAPKTVKMNFDTTVMGVMGFRVSCTPGGTISKVYIKTISGVDKDVTINKTCNAYGWAADLTYADLGIERTDYLTEVIYDAGVIPAVTKLRRSMTDDCNWSLAYYGVRFTDSDSGVSTFEVYDTDNRANTTGVSQVTTRFGAAASLDLSTMATQVVEAGNTLKFSINATPYATSIIYTHAILNPIIYIRQELRGADGEFLPISNLKILNGSSRGNEDITAKFGQITSFDTDTARVYAIDGRNVKDGSANISTGFLNKSGALSYTYLNISYTVETSLSTPDQTHNIRDMVFVQNPGVTAMSSHHYNGDPFGVTRGLSGATIYAVGSNYYQVRGSQSITVDNAAKHSSSSIWSKWSEDSNPIAIGTSESSALNMNMQVLNNSGVSVPGPTTIYMPIPKRGENWGGLNYDEKDFEFSAALTSEVGNPDANVFEIFYGKNVTPSDDGTALENASASFTKDVSNWTEADWKEVNSVKIIARNIPAEAPSGGYDFAYHVRVVDTTNVSDGATDTWRPIYYQKLTNSSGDSFAGWYGASYISIRLADGKISGQLFVDANENGKFDTDESALKEAGWKVELYDRASNRLVQTTETDANGKYEFIEVLDVIDGYYMHIANKHPITYGADGGYLFTKKGEASVVGNFNSENQVSGDNMTNPVHSLGYINPVSPSRNENEATYNVGLVENKTALETNIEISAPDKVDSKNAAVDYVIKYSANIKKYAGSATMKLVSKLPYEIVAEDSMLDGGVYDANEKTISWMITEADLNSYLEDDGVEKIEREFNISLVYDGALARDALKVEIASATELQTGDENADHAAVTNVMTPSVIRVEYVDEFGNEIADADIVNGIVGDKYDAKPKDINGYTAIYDDAEYMFEEEEGIVTRVYKKLENPKTVDMIAFYVVVFAALAAALVGIKKWHTANR